jgi:hypothetical protein
MLAGVNAGRIKKGELTARDEFDIALVMSTLFVDGDVVFDKYFKNNPAPNVLLFQEELYKTCKEKDEGRIIIVDDRELTTSAIDTTLATYKAKYGDKLALAVVDYLNQLVLDNDADMYDWKPQIVVAKHLKNMSRKHDICLVSPYQMDDNGVARFSKGILDAPDVAQLIHVEDKETGHIVFETTKARGSDDGGKYRVFMDWNTLNIDPRQIILEDLDGSDKEEEKPQKEHAREEGLDF